MNSLTSRASSSASPPSNPNLLTPRAAMGVPDGFAERIDHDLFGTNRHLFDLSPSELVNVVESSTEPVEVRYAAGTVLGMVGDPRIRPLDPEMIRLEGGRFTMGLAAEEVSSVVADWRHCGVIADWIAKECPAHEVDLASFAISRFPVTNVEYRQFLQETASTRLPTSWTLGTYAPETANRPVWTVTPEDADQYVAWLAARSGRPFRLPTEAEWEFAAANGGDRQYPWGDRFDADCANTAEAGPLMTTPVGMYRRGRTPAGIDDMAGNVEEYTSDDYAPYPGGSFISDDLINKEGPYRISRGGSFSRFGDLTRCRRRHGWYRSPIYAMGFRVAESL